MKKLLKILVGVGLAWGAYAIWTYPPAEVRPILEASEKVAAQYEHGMDEAFEQGKDVVYLRDIVTAVPWDKVCGMGGYEHPRELLASNGEGDYPELDYFGSNSENEGALIFIKEDKVVALVRGMYGNSNGYFDLCASKDIARYMLHQAEPEIYKKGTHSLDIEAMIRAFVKCTSDSCQTTFIGDKK
jgi:hypothetical protein